MAVGSATFDQIAVWREITPPTANFSGDPLEIEPGEGVSFTDLSTDNPTSWDWEFGDGETKVDYFTATAIAPVTDFTANVTSGIVPLTVSFSDLSSQGTGAIVEWSWSFGDEETSDEQNPVHIYNEAGTFTVTLTVTDEFNLSDTETKVDYITVVEPAQVVITSFTGNPAGFFTLGWEGAFSQQNGNSADILSGLSNQYTVDFRCRDYYM